MSILRRFLGPLMTNGWAIAKGLGIANACPDRTLAPIEDCPNQSIKRRLTIKRRLNTDLEIEPGCANRQGPRRSKLD